METMMRPSSPPPAPRRQDFRLDSAATSPYATAPSSPLARHAPAPVPVGSDSPFGSVEAAGSQFLTAPPSPNPFDLLPPSTPRLAGAANPFDLFQHFSSAPASPRRAAAIYAHFRGGDEEDHDDEDDDEGFQPRSSYSTTGASAVPFDWEERPGTPKAGMGGGGGAAWDDDTDFEFGTVADKTAPADKLFEKGRIRPLKPLPLLKTGDELSDKGKIRPLKPPPGLLDGGSVASSPRSPMMTMRSPRRRSRVGSGTDFDPFEAALLEATKAPSPLGGKQRNNSGVASGSPPKKADPFAARPASKSAGWRKWRLSDLLLFRSSSEGGRISNKDPLFKCSPAPGEPTAKASAAPAMVKFSSMDKLPKKHAGGDKSAAAAAEGIVGCARLSPLQRLARGLGGHSWHHGRGVAAPGIKE